MTTPKQRIRDLLAENGWTYRHLAAEIGISQQAVSEVINGRTTGATARYSVARALGAYPEDIWRDSHQRERLDRLQEVGV